jgi:hypothetical protein
VYRRKVTIKTKVETYYILFEGELPQEVDKLLLSFIQTLIAKEPIEAKELTISFETASSAKS